MNKAVTSSLGMLGGVLLIVAGVSVALVTGLDLLFGLLGLAMATGGGGLAWWSRRRSPEPESNTADGERSVQRPPSPTETAASRFKEKI